MRDSPLPRVLLVAGVIAWLGAALAAVLTSTSYPLFPYWALFSFVFLAAFVWNVRSTTPTVVALAAQSGSVIAMVAMLCNGYEGLLLVAVAAELALQRRFAFGLSWVIAQSLLLGLAIAFHWSPQAALLVSVPYLGFQLLMFAAMRLFVDEREMRQRIAAANEALLKLQAESLDKSRLEERLRIAQDLHDSLGHHLVTLGLHLELAAHESQGAAQAAVRTAQTMARAALGDVKAIVRRQHDETPVDLRREMDALAGELLQPSLHINYPANVVLADPRVSRALLRAVQEIVTNAIRHGEAHNLWIDIDRRDDRVTLAARDDGHSGAHIVEGFGISGMRRRIEELGGTLSATSMATGGFEVRAELPCANAGAG